MRKKILQFLMYSGIFIVLGVISIFFWLWIKSLISDPLKPIDSFTQYYVLSQNFLLLFVLIILCAINGWKAHTNTAASILTIAGVLGTFIGIFAGLQEFTTDSSMLQESISELLKGLKFAFGTSIVGIGSALLLKGAISPFFQVIQNRNNPIKHESDVFIEKFSSSLKTELQPLVNSGENRLPSQVANLVEVLEKDKKSMNSILNDKVLPLLKTIRDSLTSEDTSVLNRLQSLTSTVPEKIDSLAKLQKDEGIQTRKSIVDLQTALTDKQNQTFIQLKTLTKNITYEHNKLRTEFEAFSNNVSETFSKLATDELIKALKSVIDEFNTNMVNQFGENFKHLNEAVDSMVEWQKEHRLNLEKLTEEFQIAAKSIEKSRESIISIAESSNQIAIRSESIVSSSEKLDPILHTLNGQLETFDKMSNNVQNAMPIIGRSINELTTGFSETVKKAIEDSHASMEGQREAFEEQYTSLQKSIDETSKQVSEMTTKFSETVHTIISDSNGNLDAQRQAFKDIYKEFGNALNNSSQQYKEIVNGIKEQIDRVFEESANQIVKSTSEFTKNLSQQLEKPLSDFSDNLSKNVNESIGKSQNSVDQQLDALKTQSEQLDRAIRESVNTMQAQVDVLQKGLEKALEESLNGLVGQLTSLSNKFAEDYEPLTRRLQRIVEIANDVQNQETDIHF